jgi:hypothetical protein
VFKFRVSVTFALEVIPFLTSTDPNPNFNSLTLT